MTYDTEPPAVGTLEDAIQARKAGAEITCPASYHSPRIRLGKRLPLAKLPLKHAFFGGLARRTPIFRARNDIFGLHFQSQSL